MILTSNVLILSIFCALLAILAAFGIVKLQPTIDHRRIIGWVPKIYHGFVDITHFVVIPWWGFSMLWGQWNTLKISDIHYIVYTICVSFGVVGHFIWDTFLKAED